jgi:hypothetical protein
VTLICKKRNIKQPIFFMTIEAKGSAALTAAEPMVEKT